jgi:predicted Zn-dependent protease
MPSVRVWFGVHPQSVLSRALFKSTAAPLLLTRHGWAKYGFRFHVVDQRHDADITITLTPQTVMDTEFPEFANDRLSVCNLKTRDIFVNEGRWLGIYHDNRSGMPLPAYRMYVIQHEVGHALGVHTHATVTDRQQPCPVMVQQTKGTEGAPPHPFPTTPDLRLLQ